MGNCITHCQSMIMFETLKGVDHSITHNFRHFIKENFCIYVTSNGEEVLGRKRKKKDILPVATYENYFDIIYNLHSLGRMHCGLDKTEHQVKLRYDLRYANCN